VYILVGVFSCLCLMLLLGVVAVLLDRRRARRGDEQSHAVGPDQHEQPAPTARSGEYASPSQLFDAASNTGYDDIDELKASQRYAKLDTLKQQQQQASPHQQDGEYENLDAMRERMMAHQYATPSDAEQNQAQHYANPDSNATSQHYSSPADAEPAAASHYAELDSSGAAESHYASLIDADRSVGAHYVDVDSARDDVAYDDVDVLQNGDQ
jgi:hypothetical protein